MTSSRHGLRRSGGSPRPGLRLAGVLLAGLLLAVPASFTPRSASAQSGARTSATPDRPAVQGTVRSIDARRGPLAYAMIEVLGPGNTHRVLADSAGRYHLEGLGPGHRRIRALHVGYEPAEVDVLVPTTGTVTVDLELRSRPVELAGLLVEADPLRVSSLGKRATAEEERAQALVRLRALTASPGLAEAGLAEAARTLPGNDPMDPSDVLFMRGSTADLKLVLLDGAPVYTPFHLGGLLQSFDPAVLGGAAHHLGGAPARYDGGLSYILDLRTRVPGGTRVRSSGAVDLVSARANVEAPLGERTGILASARTLHDGAGALYGGEGSPYGYVDGLLRAEHRLGGDDRLSLTLFGNRESVRLGLGELAGSVPLPDDASWGNAAVSAGYHGRLGGLAVDVGLAASRYRAELPLPALPDDGPEIEELPGVPATRLTTGRTDRTRLTFDASLPDGPEGLRFGASVDRMAVRYGVKPVTGNALTLTERDAADGTVVGAYFDGVQNLVPELDLRYGARLDHFSPGGLKGALRLAFLWSLAPDAVLTLAGGRYHQLIRSADVEADLAVAEPLVGVGAGPAAAGPLRAPLMGVARADHLALSLDQLLRPSVRLTLEGFLKDFRGVGGAEGSGLASSGVDLRVLRQGEGVTGWLGYSLVWFWETDTAPGGSPDVSGRHLLSAGVRGRVAGPAGVDLRLSFTDGLPLTAVPVAFEDATSPSRSATDDGGAPTRPSGIADGFLRLDAELYADLTTEWFGSETTLRPYLRILNALDRRDALFYYFEPWRDDGLRPLAEMAVVPVVGLEWRF